MPDPSSSIWGIPVRIVSQPSGNWLSAPIVNLVIGFLLGFCAEPARELIKHRRANRELYREIGAYFGRFVVLREKTGVTGVGGAQFDIMSWQEITRPNLPYFDYYSGREPGVFLRVENPQGIQELVAWLRYVGNTYRNPNQMPFQHPDSNVFCSDVVQGYDRFCSTHSSKKRLLKAFNRHAEAKAIGFPIRGN